jgi:hypothetical protein
MTTARVTLDSPGDGGRVAGEQHSQRLVTTFIVSGMLFMLLPGTFLGVWNLLSISQAHEPSSLPTTWIQAYGQAEIFGWIGSFILGIGLYSLTKMRSTRSFPTMAGWMVWLLWTSGVLIRWATSVSGTAWRMLLPLSGVLELFGFLIFYLSVRRHRPTAATAKPQAWTRVVIGSTIGFMLTLVVNCSVVFWQAFRGASPASSHITDEQMVVLSVWGVLVPTIWGFNARWLPIFIGLRQPDGRRLCTAYGISIAGIVATFLRMSPIAAVAFMVAALLGIDALHVWKPAINPAKLLNVHGSFPWFIRLTYVWLVISCALAVLAVSRDTSGGLWGASRHALTVGYVAGMVFAIGQRVLPAFCGMHILWSKRLMFWSSCLLFFGCSLRVFSEPLAYENIWVPAWRILPASAVIELTAVSLFAINIAVTLLQPATHLRLQTTHS